MEEGKERKNESVAVYINWGCALCPELFYVKNVYCRVGVSKIKDFDQKQIARLFCLSKLIIYVKTFQNLTFLTVLQEHF